MLSQPVVLKPNDSQSCGGSQNVLGDSCTPNTSPAERNLVCVADNDAQMQHQYNSTAKGLKYVGPALLQLMQVINNLPLLSISPKTES